MITGLRFNNNLKKLSLMLCHDKKHHPVIYIGTDESHKVLFKKFCGRFDLDKFLVEAVMLRMCASKKNLTDVRDFYNRLCMGLNAIEEVSNEKI